MPTTTAEDVLGVGVTERVLHIPGIQIGVQEVIDRPLEKPIVAGARFLTNQQVERAPGKRLQVLRDIATDPIRRLEVVIKDRDRCVRLVVLRGGPTVPHGRVLSQIEPKLCFEGELRAQIQAAKHTPKDDVVFGYVVLRIKSILEGIARVDAGDAFAAGKITVDVVDLNDGLQQDVLAEDAAFTPVVIRDSAVMTISGDRDVLTEVQLGPVERGIDPNATTAEVIVFGRAGLIIVIEGNIVRVGVAAALDVQVVIRNGRGTPHSFPPVGTLTAWHDQGIRV